jgi:hypothetical protein
MFQIVNEGIARLGDVAKLEFIQSYLRPRALLRSDATVIEGAEEQAYTNEEVFWQDVIRRQHIYETRQVLLEEFLLLEWIPMLPGQYHTQSGWHARQEARSHIIESNQRSVIYDPYGKAQMLRGGKGCIRIAAKEVQNETIRFLCATSSGVAHRGLLIGVPDDTYRMIAGPLQTNGGVVCSIRGHIRRISLREEMPFAGGDHLDCFYLYAEQIQPLQTTSLRAEASRVTAAITFRGKFKERPGTYFTYGAFDPGNPESIQECSRWLEQDYVKHRHQGQVLTNFDEYASHFETVRLPITTLMDATVDATSISKEIANMFDLDAGEVSQVNKYVTNIYAPVQGLIVGDNPQVRMQFDG